MRSICIQLLLILLVSPLAYCQSVDNTFINPVIVRPAYIRCIKPLPDGKILLGGDIAFFKTTPVNNLIRLKNDSTLDETFNFTADKQLLIKNIEIQSSGNLIVMAQGYDSQRGVYNADWMVFRLNPNGTILNKVDTLKELHSMVVQSDDKVLVCGGLRGRGYLYRLTSSLSMDPVFENGIRFNDLVACVAVSGNNLLAGGAFTSVNGLPRKSIIRLNQAGIVDDAYNTGTGTSDVVYSLTVQSDGKTLIGGSFINSFNGVNCRGLARLNQDGSVDTSLQPLSFQGPLSEITVVDSKIYLATSLTLNSTFGSYLLRLRSDGTLDTGFKPISLNTFLSFCMAKKDDNFLINNSSATGSVFGVSECDTAGNFINSFSPEVLRPGLTVAGDYMDGKLIIAGDFIKVNGTFTFGLARLDKNGILDKTFILNRNPGAVVQIKIAGNNDLFVSTRQEFMKLDGNAQNNPGFVFRHFKTLYNVDKFRILNDGKIYAADPNNVFRLNPDGTEDTGFNVGTGINTVCTSFDFDIQDSKVILGSAFTMFNGTGVNRMVRLNPDGSVDNTFNTGTGPDGDVTLIKVLDSGEIIAGGLFTHFNGYQVPHKIVKLTKDGAVATNFLNNQKASFYKNGINVFGSKAEQVDSMVYIRNSNSIAVFDVNGNIYNDFTIPVGINVINDIITTKDSTLAQKGIRSINSESARNIMYAFGSFGQSGNTSSVIKLKLSTRTIEFLNVSEDTLFLPGNAGSTSKFDIFTNQPWSISCNQEWLSISTTSGADNTTVKITSSANLASSPRTAILTITGNNLNATVTIVQAGSSNEINVYPSPVKDKLYIDFPDQAGFSEINIISSTGKKVYISKVAVPEIDMSFCRKGIYFVSIMTNGKIVFIKKIIKQ